MSLLRVVNGYKEDVLDSIMVIYKELCNGNDKEGVLEESRAFYREVMINPQGIVVVIIDDEGKVAGYALGLPQNMAANYHCIKRFDPQIKNNSSTFYIDTLEVREGYHQTTYFLQLAKKLVAEAEQKGFFEFSMYIRTEISQKFLDVIKRRITPNASIVRSTMGDWYGVEEPYDRIEACTRR